MYETSFDTSPTLRLWTESSWQGGPCQTTFKPSWSQPRSASPPFLISTGCQNFFRFMRCSDTPSWWLVWLVSSRSASSYRSISRKAQTTTITAIALWLRARVVLGFRLCSIAVERQRLRKHSVISLLSCVTPFVQLLIFTSLLVLSFWWPLGKYIHISMWFPKTFDILTVSCLSLRQMKH